MSTIQVDRQGFDQICKGNNEGMDMKKKMHELSRYIDSWYKRSCHLLGSLDSNNPEHKTSITELHTQLKTLEFVSQKIEHLFQITVLTEPRE